MKLFELKGKKALVTGSSRGIGRAIAVALAKQGADVAVHGHRESTELKAAADEIKGLNVEAFSLVSDLGTEGGVTTLLHSLSQAWEHLDILVSNVSVQIPASWQEITRDQFDTQVNTNFRSALELIQCFAPGMIKREWGRIVTIGSVQETKPVPDMVVYAALKNAQTAMVRNLAKQFAPHGVTVNNLAPGAINTDRNRERLGDEAYRQKVLTKIPAGTIGEPEDCVGAALLLCSEAGRYITGQNLFVDGGMSLG